MSPTKRPFWVTDAEYPEDSGFLVFDGADAAEARKKGADWLGHGDDVTGVTVYEITAADVQQLQEMAERSEELPGLRARAKESRELLAEYAVRNDMTCPADPDCGVCWLCRVRTLLLSTKEPK